MSFFYFSTVKNKKSIQTDIEKVVQFGLKQVAQLDFLIERTEKNGFESIKIISCQINEFKQNNEWQASEGI